MATQGGTRKFQGCTLTIVSPAVITLQHEKTYMISLTEEEVVSLHAIFFDPTLILEIAEMDPENIFFGDDYAELRWKFEIGKRSHLVTIRLPEHQSLGDCPGDCPGGLSPEGVDPEIFALRKELKECQAQLAKCQADLSECNEELKNTIFVSHITKSMDIADCKYGDSRSIFSVRNGRYELPYPNVLWGIIRAIGTPYAAYAKLDSLFRNEELRIFVAYGDENIDPYVRAMIRHMEKNYIHVSMLELSFNHEYCDISIVDVFIIIDAQKGFEKQTESAMRRRSDIWWPQLSYISLGSSNAVHSSCIELCVRGYRSKNKYAYLIRKGNHVPPVSFDMVFDIKDIIDKKEQELREYLPAHANPTLSRNILDKVSFIYKVRV